MTERAFECEPTDYFFRTPTGDGVRCKLKTIRAIGVRDGAYTEETNFYFVMPHHGKTIMLTQEQFNMLEPVGEEQSAA